MHRALSFQLGDVFTESSLNVLVSLVFYNWYFMSYVVTFWLQGLSILMRNAFGLKKKVQLYRHVQLQRHRHVAFLLCFHLFHFSMWFIREQFCYVRFSVCTSLHPVPHGTLNFE